MQQGVVNLGGGATRRGLRWSFGGHRRLWHPRSSVSVRAACLLVLVSACGSQRRTVADGGVENGQRDSSVDDAATRSPNSDDSHTVGVASDTARIDSLAGSEFCARPGQDAVRELFCGRDRPRITGLADLQEALGVTPGPNALHQSGQKFTAVVLNSHSTTQHGQLVSPINPRAILLAGTNRRGLALKVVMAFQRGVQQVELVAPDQSLQRLNFYLLTYRQACNDRDGGCLPGDLFTPRIERDWLRVKIEDDADLKNTPADCRQCHQRGIDAPVLLMRELHMPWTHFFSPEPAGAFPGVSGGDLINDYLAAKADEPYAGILPSAVQTTLPFLLESIADAPQPLLFDGAAIRSERWPVGPDGYPEQPLQSPTWQSAYAAFKRGEQMALPYFAGRATDPDKQARLTEDYRRFLAGDLPAEELPDLADIYPDDPQVRAEIGLQTDPDGTPAEALVQACGGCHNDVLDQNISRARFNIALSRMDEAARMEAVERIGRQPDAPGVMPPAGVRQLDPDTRRRLGEYLAQSKRPSEDDAFLDRASSLGMARPSPGPASSGNPSDP
ncbi:MAG: hypothetical protein OXU20_38725 [Myxococcales bacterium]|nr:hypothetical protein [Myxococcales bacterium]MDD9969041.1 hypothetical protein [Myxococcales bacterium]